MVVIGVVFLLSFWLPMANCGFHMNKYTCTTLSQYSNNCTKIQSVYQIFMIFVKMFDQKSILRLIHFYRFRRETEKSQTETGIHFGSRPTINIFRGWKRPEPKNQEKNQRISKEAFIGSAWSTLGCPRRNESQRRGTYFFHYQFLFRFIS